MVLFDEIFEGSESFEEMEASYTEILDRSGAEGIVMKFMGNYIFEIFCRNFYERWQDKVGPDLADSTLNDVKEYIVAEVDRHFNGKILSDFNWEGPQGVQVSNQILHEVFDIFEVPN